MPTTHPPGATVSQALYAQLGVELMVLLLVAAACVAGFLAWRALRLSPPPAPGAAVASPTGARDRGGEPAARRVLRLGVGALWILDAALQAQPSMPGDFITGMVGPALAGQPSWLIGLILPATHLWLAHPVVADAVTVWIQAGIGAVLLAGGRGWLLRLGVVASVTWGLVVWVLAEMFGGLLVPGASWLTGSPGAVLVYVAGAALLLVRDEAWRDGRCARWIRRGVGVVMLAGAGLAVWPWEGMWTATGLAGVFTTGAQTQQPTLLAAPLLWMLRTAQHDPVASNAVIVAALAVVGGGLLSGRVPRPFVGAGLVVAAATWWLGQDFGVLGGMSTDPNTAVPVALLLVAGWPSGVPRTVPEGAGRGASGRSGWIPGVAEAGLPALRVGTAGAGVGALVLVPVLLLTGATGPVSPLSAVADSGGVQQPVVRPAPDFHLVDQSGRPVSLSRWRGRMVVLTFLDPVCFDSCPIIANQLALADKALGSLARDVQFVAIVANPVYHSVGDVQAFDREHGLTSLANWSFLTGTTRQLAAVWKAYGILVVVPTVGMVMHSQNIYFLSPDGREVGILGDSATPTLTSSYATLIAGEIRRTM
ncbi:MAG: SCO family protein [Actinomycetes bacterium]